MTPSEGEHHLHLNALVRAIPDQVSTEVDNETVILSLRTGEYYGLNLVAADIWKLIQEPRRVSDVRDDLVARYQGVDVETCTRELMDVLDDMLKLQLAEVVRDGD